MSELSTLSKFETSPTTVPKRSTNRTSLGFAAQKSVVPVSKDVATLQDFAKKIEQEFIQGSGIAPLLYAAGIAIVGDTEVLAGREVAYPIAEALNWKLTRFGQRARETLFAALFLNEDGFIHHSKLSRSLEVGKKAYCAPTGSGSRGYLPPIPMAIRQLISQQYGIKFPSDGSFWDFVECHPEIPIVITEGDKKSLSLLSAGYVTIALYGVN